MNSAVWTRTFIWSVLLCLGLYVIYSGVQQSLPVWRSSYIILAPPFAAVLALRLASALRRSSTTGPVLSAIRFALEAWVAFFAPFAISSVWEELVTWWRAFSGQPAPVLIAVLFVPAVALVVLLLFSAWLTLLSSRRRVFVSFHHSQEGFAEELTVALTRVGLTVRRIPFSLDQSHDQLLVSVLEEIRACDAVVCVPGPRASFVENEILAASTLRKLIVFVVGGANSRLPNTALYGYPVFRLDRVQRLHFEPVADLLLLGIGSWRATLRHLNSIGHREDAGSFGLFPDLQVGLWAMALLLAGPYLAGFVSALVTGGGFQQAVLFAATLHVRLGELAQGWNVRWWLFVLYMTFAGTVTLLVNQLRARSVLKQQIVTGRATRDTLRKQIGRSRVGRRILACLWSEPPPADHEVGPADNTNRSTSL